MLIGGSEPVPKDAVIAILGASAALAGLVLVFLGLLLPAFHKAWAADVESFNSFNEWEKVFNGLRLALILTLIALIFCFASVGLSLAWLTVPGGHDFYVGTIWLFVAELLAVFAVAVSAIVGLLRAGVPQKYSGESDSPE